MGFVRGPVHEPALETQTVLEESLVAALPSGHRLGRHKRLRLAMLADEPFVLQARSLGAGSHDQILAVCRSAGFSPRVVQEGSQAEVASLVASGQVSRSFRRRCARSVAPVCSIVRYTSGR